MLCARCPAEHTAEPVQNSEIYGRIKRGYPGLKRWRSIPVCGSAGDQQAALFGQCCLMRHDKKIRTEPDASLS